LIDFLLEWASILQRVGDFLRGIDGGMATPSHRFTLIFPRSLIDFYQKRGSLSKVTLNP
jgi:hypothetical protein